MTLDNATLRFLTERGKQAALRDIERGMIPVPKFAYLAKPRNGLARWSVL